VTEDDRTEDNRTEDNRVARADGEPSKHGPAGAARWSAYLDWVRQEIVDGVLGLTEEEQRTTRLASGWTPIELLSHVLHMERRWFLWGFLGEDLPDVWGDWSRPEPWQHEDDPDVRWQVPEDVTADDLAARLEGLAVRVRKLLRELPLEARAVPGPRFDEGTPTLRWICQHVVHEYARHAGHLDIVRELGAADPGE
jgi:uncharacterized damage-inducible protein DinB